VKIPLFAWPYRVRSAVEGWRGWRLGVRYLGIAEPCDCPELEHLAEPCECKDREPHNHSGLMALDTPIGRSPNHPWWGDWR
jgi:hypothetical protein